MVSIFFILLFISGIANAIMDKLQFHFNGSVFSKPPFEPTFWDPKTSWKNKYKERGNSFMYNLIERLDNNSLVMFTDGWHLMQAVWRFTLFAALIMYGHIGPLTLFDSELLNISFEFISMSTAYLGGFVLFFGKILNINRKKM